MSNVFSTICGPEVEVGEGGFGIIEAFPCVEETTSVDSSPEVLRMVSCASRDNIRNETRMICFVFIEIYYT